MQGTIEQKKLFQRNASIGIGLAVLVILGSVGLLVAIAGPGTAGNDNMIAILFIGARMLALVFWFWGLAEYSKSKGYSGSHALWGLLGVVGLLVLAAKKDQFLIGTPDTGSIYPRTGQTF